MKDVAIVTGFPYTIQKVGTIVVYADERGVTLKKLTFRKTPNGDKKPTLVSLNPAFKDITPMDGGKITATYVEILPE